MSDKPTVDVQVRAEPPAPLTEDELQAIEDRWRHLPVGEGERTSAESIAVIHWMDDRDRVLAEVRRLRALFPDPEADARLIDSEAEEEEHQMYPFEANARALRDLAARLRSLQGEP